MYPIDLSDYVIPQALTNASKKELFVSSETDSSEWFSEDDTMTKRFKFVTRTDSHAVIKIEKTRADFKGEVGAPLNRFKPSNKLFTDCSKAVLLLWIFYVFVCLVLAVPLCASVYMCLVDTCWERADLLTLVCGV